MATPQPFNQSPPLSYVSVAPLNGAATIRVPAITSNTPKYYVLGTPSPSGTPANAEANPIKTDAALPKSILPSMIGPGQQFAASSGNAQFFWVYLRRPANPFDETASNTTTRPNREMVVVDSMRFPLIEAGGKIPTAKPVGGNFTFTPNTGANTIYSTRRLQPYRGGHLVPTNTPPGPGATMPMGFTTITPPKPGYAWGYSEQTDPGTTGTTAQSIFSMDKSTGQPATSTSTAANIVRDPTQVATSTKFQHTLGTKGGGSDPTDTNWSHLPFHDRDFTSVAELLLVPGCPPGLFTKQFVEEPYPGNDKGKGFDDSSFLMGGSLYSATAKGIIVPTAPNRGRKDFNITSLPSFPTYPYLSDNFYYTAASVAPPAAGGGLDAGYTSLTTEIGGWTGAGWHKMLEFFEVPSSANGATGFANNGNNYDWYRADVKPGLINLNLIIDEEVFAGVLDDPRMNENLAAYTSSIPAVVTQIDGNGYPVYNNDSTSTTYGLIYGAQPMFSLVSSNPTVAQSPTTFAAGRGYVIRDPNIANYNAANAPNYQPQQVHGLKAAFADFLKLRHGGSGYLFAYGNGPTGSGDYPIPFAVNGFFTSIYPAQTPQPYLQVPLTQPTQPIAAERPYRSLSYPDINYTVMRPASLPPSPPTVVAGNTITPGTTPPLPVSGNSVFQYPQYPLNNALPAVPVVAGLEALLGYAGIMGPPYVQMVPNVAPAQQATNMGNNYQYVFDPGLKNPFLPIQYQPGNTPPPYATPSPAALPAVTPAPFPPTIPPTPARRLFQIPDHDAQYTGANISNADMLGGFDSSQAYGSQYAVNQPTIPQQLSTGAGQALTSPQLYGFPPTLVSDTRNIFYPDNYTPGKPLSNLLGAGRRQRLPPAPALPDRVAPEDHEPDDGPDAPVRGLDHGRVLRGGPARHARAGHPGLPRPGGRKSRPARAPATARSSSWIGPRPPGSTRITRATSATW